MRKILLRIYFLLWRPELWQEQETMTGYLYTVTGMKFQLVQASESRNTEDKVLKAQLLGELCDEDSSLLENLYYKEVLMLSK